MASRSSDQVKRELESERERLGRAATTLRTQSGMAARRLALAAVGVAAVAVVARAVAARVFDRD
jgi:cystathionine beta-lyase/cystathionine gamma-synthase